MAPRSDGPKVGSSRAKHRAEQEKGVTLSVKGVFYYYFCDVLGSSANTRGHNGQAYTALLVLIVAGKEVSSLSFDHESPTKFEEKVTCSEDSVVEAKLVVRGMEHAVLYKHCQLVTLLKKPRKKPLSKT